MEIKEHHEQYDKTKDNPRGIYLLFFTQVQTPVTLCGGRWWSILVVRLAHSADLRSQLRHVSSAGRPVSSVLTVFSLSSILASQLSGRTSSAEWRQGRNNFFPCVFVAWITHLSPRKFFVGFRMVNWKSTQGKTNCQKTFFADDQVRGHHPRASKSEPTWKLLNAICYREIGVKGQRLPAVFPGPLRDGRRSGADEGLGSRLIVAKCACWGV